MSLVLPVGVAVRDITPPQGLAMAGFVAREGPALGTHDPLTVRALAVGDTVLAVVDVVALSAASSRRIRQAASLPDDRIVLAALHTHGGPVSTQEGLGEGADPVWLAAMEAACVAAIDEAIGNRRPATLAFAALPDPGIARNRRHAGRPVDAMLRLLTATGIDGSPIAELVTYACHPVVLGADNRLWTADYPGVVRALLEARHPGSVALFATGCAGDLNTGHTAHGSITTAAQSSRTFAEAARIGAVLAAALERADLRPLDGSGEGAAAQALETWVPLTFARNEPAPPETMAAAWRAEREGAAPGRRALLDSWIGWAGTLAREPLRAEPARVSLLRWGPLRIAALPGEIFSDTGLVLDRALGAPAMVLAYADACPGYVPPVAEYPHGGYEVDEAHRYYGARAACAPGCAERLADAAARLAGGRLGPVPARI